MKEKARILYEELKTFSIDDLARLALAAVFITTFGYATLMVAQTIQCPDNICMHATKESFSAFETVAKWIVGTSLVTCIGMLLLARPPWRAQI